MSTHTIKRTMLRGNDFDSGELEFVLKIEHPEGDHLVPFAPELESAVSTPEAFNNYVLFGALLGNTIHTAPFEQYGHRVAKHETIWTDELSVTVPDELD